MSRQLESFRCVVDCSDANGTPAFFGCTVKCSWDDYNNGVHYDKAKAKAINAGYDGLMIVHDSNDGPDWLFEHVFGITEEIS